jgi:hypothetical protein
MSPHAIVKMSILFTTKLLGHERGFEPSIALKPRNVIEVPKEGALLLAPITSSGVSEAAQAHRGPSACTVLKIDRTRVNSGPEDRRRGDFWRDPELPAVSSAARSQLPCIVQSTDALTSVASGNWDYLRCVKRG